MFEYRLRFDLAAVLDLADHADASPAHDAAVAGEPAGPALLLVADPAAAHAVYLASNGRPPLPPADGQPGVHQTRVVFAEGLGPATTRRERVHATGTAQESRIGLPLRQRAYRPLIDPAPRFRAARPRHPHPDPHRRADQHRQRPAPPPRTAVRVRHLNPHAPAGRPGPGAPSPARPAKRPRFPSSRRVTQDQPSCCGKVAARKSTPCPRPARAGRMTQAGQHRLHTHVPLEADD